MAQLQTKAAIRFKDYPDTHPYKTINTRFALNNFQTMKEEALPKSLYAAVSALNTQLRNG